ncbi:phosphatidylserine decarboxylase [Mycena crocata]|nr:phosphatidylserine decarboxylase [Mycena crocata]
MRLHKVVFIGLKEGPIAPSESFWLLLVYLKYLVPRSPCVNQFSDIAFSRPSNDARETAALQYVRHSGKLTTHFRRAGWLPASKEALEEWVGGMAAKVARSRHSSPAKLPVLVPEIVELKKYIESNSEIYMGFHRMLTDEASPFSKHISSYEVLLAMMDKVIKEAPSYGDVGTSIGLLLVHAMNTHAGFTTFLNMELNTLFKGIFDKWAVFLSSPASCYVLTAHGMGWFTPPALQALTKSFGGLPFEEIFVCNPAAEHYGFTSYDDFFSRRLRPGIRAVGCPHNDDIIVAACESQLYKIATDVKERDMFWIKGEPYSLLDMLNHDESAQHFVGGTVFQGFLQVTNYHRWHAPAAGVVKKIVPVPGTYFCQSPANIGEPEETAYLRSLAFLTAVSARQLFFIEADNPRIGLYCFIAIGMAEISGMEAKVQVGQKVKKGQELGLFHFGGSSHAVVFGGHTRLRFFDAANEQGNDVGVRAAIAAVVP